MLLDFSQVLLGLLMLLYNGDLGFIAQYMYYIVMLFHDDYKSRLMLTFLLTSVLLMRDFQAIGKILNVKHTDRDSLIECMCRYNTIIVHRLLLWCPEVCRPFHLS